VEAKALVADRAASSWYGQDMWIEKLTEGVLQLDTAIGPRFVQPNLVQRAYLLWTFRNFFSLPHQVLRPWEIRLIDRLLTENRFVPSPLSGAQRRPVIGRVEARVAGPSGAPLHEAWVDEAAKRNAGTRKPVANSSSAIAERNREAASA
jgi:hypothetical protein